MALGDVNLPDTHIEGRTAEETVLELPVRTLQKALAHLHGQNSRVSSPGAIDGVWGPRTQASFESWEATLTGDVGTIEGVSSDDRRVRLSAALASQVERAAAAYDRAHAVTPGSAGQQRADLPARVPTQSALVRAAQSNWWVWALVGAGVIGLAASLWWYFKKKRR